MDHDLMHGFRARRLDPAIATRFWQYEGVGWPRSRAEIRLWVPGVAIILALTIWGYVSIGPNGRLEPGRTELHKTDFTVFTEAGAAFFDGRNPYRVANPRGWHYLYPPLFALLAAPLSVFDTESQVLIWFVVNVALAFGCFGEMRRLFRGVTQAESHGLSWVVVCACLAAVPPVLDCMQAGQLGIAILYLLILGFRLLLQDQSRSRWFLGGMVLALPAVIKLVPSLPVAFVVVQRWWFVAKIDSGTREWARATTLTAGVVTGVVLFMLAIPSSLIGWRANLDYLGEWHSRIVINERVGPSSNFNIHSYRNQSLANAFYLWEKATTHAPGHESQPKSGHDRPERITQPAVRVLIGVVLAILAVVGCSLGSEKDPLDLTAAYGLACCATLLVSPLSWGHYYMAQAPAVLFVPAWLMRRDRPKQARVVAVIPPVLSWSFYLTMPYTGVLGILGLGTTVWFLTVCGLILVIEVVGTPGARKGSTRLDIAGGLTPAFPSQGRFAPQNRWMRVSRSMGAQFDD